MIRLLKLPLAILFSISLLFVNGQNVRPFLLEHTWKASWITVPGIRPDAYGVYSFRKSVNLSSQPASFLIHVSADNRYQLFVNETLVSLGPARGDINHWNYETVNIARYLSAGKNVVAAKIWNDGDWRPEAQITLRTGFILQGADAAEEILNTDDTWKCIRDSSYRPIKISLPTYYVTGPGELVDMNTHVFNWEKSSLNDSSWSNAQKLSAGVPKNILGGYGTHNEWMLVPSSLPQMELTKQRLVQTKRSQGITVPPPFPGTKTALRIPANTEASILLDQTFLTNAYPTLEFSGGKAAGILITYAEALYDKYPAKGNRDDVAGKIIMGRKDSIISNGDNAQRFTTLAYRTYRYLELKVTTKEDPLLIEDIYGTFTGYPFEFKAKFQTPDASLEKIMQIGWRTARLCAVETYMDCPYYEQLQYIADGRIQALVSLYNSGDDRLFKNALNLMDQSRQPEGLTESRHPSYTPQYIPTFSLWYIGMLHDYYMYGRDTNFIKNKIAGMRQVLEFFRRYQQKDGSLKGVPDWMFTDWVTSPGWVSGTGPVGKNGNSALNDLQLLLAYQTAADLEAKTGMKAFAELYLEYAAQLKALILEKYWDASRQLFADTPEHDLFSQHANALAILTDMVSNNEAKGLGEKILAETSLAPASIYFKYYLHRALIKAGFGNDYLNWLDKWRENISMGLTTWAEDSDINTTRSDCHAWGSSPNIEFFRTVLGIDSDAPGFKKIKIEPHLGSFKNISGEIPHPDGKLSASYQLVGSKWKIEIILPAGTTGILLWAQKQYSLAQGKNAFTL